MTKQLIDAYQAQESSIIGVQEVADEAVSKYGIVDYSQEVEDDLYKVANLVEKPALEEAPSNIAILGRYILTPEIFSILENTPPGKGNEIQLTDALETLLTQDSIYAQVFSGKRYDIGNKLGFLEATVEFALSREDTREEFSSYLAQLLSQDQEALQKIAAMKDEE